MQGASGQQRPPPPPKGDDLISQFDSDESSSLSLSELDDSKLGERLAGQFDDLDTDGDGLLNVAELDAGAKQGGGHGGPGGVGGPPPGGGQGGPQQSATTDADVESLFQSLFDALETEETTDASSVWAIAQQSYTDVQALFAQAA